MPFRDSKGKLTRVFASETVEHFCTVLYKGVNGKEYEVRYKVVFTVIIPNIITSSNPELPIYAPWTDFLVSIDLEVI